MSHTLLLADDSVTIQRVIELTFADEDVDVVAVSDGDEAIAVLEKSPPDIVLADVGMPGKNGYEVARHIKETPRLAHIPVVLLTGAFEPIDQAKATAAGCDGVLAKPFEPQLVIGRVRELLSKSKPGAGDGPLAPASWTPDVPDASPGDSAGGHPSEGGDYFDRLDQAFTNLAAEPTEPAIASPSGATPLDWFASQPPGAALQDKAPPDRWDIPPVTPAATPPLVTSFTPPAPLAFDVTVRPLDFSQARPSYSAQGRPAPLPTLPPLIDAFAALLAAEQSSPAPAAAPLWPSLPQPAAPVSDALVEHVTARVLERLTDHAVQETIAEKVSAIAERLVREEIERIKASIK